MNRAQIALDANCGTCRFYLEQDRDMGACHRYPPAFAGEQAPRDLHRWRFPLVSTRSWCGEHKASDLAAPAAADGAA